jgi:hypothetical protein
MPAFLCVAAVLALTRPAHARAPEVDRSAEDSCNDGGDAPQKTYGIEVMDDERAREQGDKVAAACAIATGFAEVTPCAEMRSLCTSGEDLRINNPWVGTGEDEHVYVPCDLMVSLTCTRGDGSLDGTQLQRLRTDCEQALAPRRDEDAPGFFNILCEIAVSLIGYPSCVAIFSWAAGTPCIGAATGLGITFSKLACALLP